MSQFLNAALDLAAKGFHVFPLVPGEKAPVIEKFPELATLNTTQIRKWWTRWPNANVGISTSAFGFDGEALLALDIDNKDGRNGDACLLRFECEGFEFPPTYAQRTPSGGRHLLYRVREAVKQGVRVFGDGVDTRSRGGFVVGAGSVVSKGPYTGNSDPLVLAPQQLIQYCGRAPQREHTAGAVVAGLDPDAAETRARFYLEHQAPVAEQGAAGDQLTYVVACRVKDLGVAREKAFELMFYLWNDRCQPPWSPEELEKKVSNAYSYGLEPIGARAPEADFKPIDTDLVPAANLHPFQVLNQEYAFVIAGGGHHILWETRDHKANLKLEHLSLETFHHKLASRTMQIGEKARAISELWMRSHDRRSYDGICFSPGRPAPDRFYNLWRGFAVEPMAAGDVVTLEAQASVDMFLDHAKQNVCAGDQALFDWLMGYFAHLVQRPWEKPLVALVFKGKKGVGKNALIDRIGHLLGNHYLVTADRRYLTGNFNGHLENCLTLVLDEAFWSGDKQSEGVLKSLVTNDHHLIERKGKEAYKVDNCTRVVVIGNEEWIVPASEDERRYAVFKVGNARRRDNAFFEKMRRGMEAGGYKLLLKLLLETEISDVNRAPETEGLLEQKVESLGVFHQWWRECLVDGAISNDFGVGEWPAELDRSVLRDSFRRYCKERQVKGWIPDDRQTGIMLRKCLPSVGSTRRCSASGRSRAYLMPTLEAARAAWAEFIGHEVAWD